MGTILNLKYCTWTYCRELVVVTRIFSI